MHRIVLVLALALTMFGPATAANASGVNTIHGPYSHKDICWDYALSWVFDGYTVSPCWYQSISPRGYYFEVRI